MSPYEELKVELLEIAKVVGQFPDEVKSKVYELLISTYLGKPSAAGERREALKGGSTMAKTRAEAAKRPPHKGVSNESYSIDRNLNLRGNDKGVPPFKTFIDEKKPSSAREFNTTAVYYLKKLMGLPEVTLNHVYTCYTEVKKKPPEHFKQSFTDIKNKLGYVDIDSNGNLAIPHRGVVFVEHDLPVQKNETE